jgi:hypothetical protein
MRCSPWPISLTTLAGSLSRHSTLKAATRGQYLQLNVPLKVHFRVIFYSNVSDRINIRPGGLKRDVVCLSADQ